MYIKITEVNENGMYGKKTYNTEEEKRKETYKKINRLLSGEIDNTSNTKSWD